MDDPMADAENWGWQATARTMKERTTYLWKNNPIPANVFFNVGPKGQKELIGAHRDFLSISSEVLYAMFYGSVTKSRNLDEAIDEDDISPEAFRLMLQFIYTDSLGQDDSSEYWGRRRRFEYFPGGVESAFDTMKAAGKYGIPALHILCRDWILNDIRKTFKTSESVAQRGLLYIIYAWNPEWTNKCIIEAVWQEVDAFADKVLLAPDKVLRTVDEKLMVEILSRGSLGVSNEITLYNFASRWARLAQGASENNRVFKDIMGRLREVIRYASMSEQKLLEGPLKDGLFTLEEMKEKVSTERSLWSQSRCGNGPPAIIGFEIFRVTDSGGLGDFYKRHDNVGELEIQTSMGARSVLALLVERFIRIQMKFNGAGGPYNQCIDFVYKEHDLGSFGFDADEYVYNDGDDIDDCDKLFLLTKEELELLATGCQTAEDLKLGLGDVAVGFEVEENKVEKMFLVFGNKSDKPSTGFYSYNREYSAEHKVFSLGRLTAGQGYLDKWNDDFPSYSGTQIVYDVSYELKALDVLPPEKNY